MKYTKLILSLGIAATLVSCGSTKTTTVEKTPKMIIATDNIVAKKGKMSKEEIHNWPHMDIIKDSVPGMSLDRAYDFVKNKKATTVIVGIIDSGVDIEHEDLKDLVWTNPKEIAGNGKDDDNNGYIDDIHGWNFLGDIDKADLEYIRIVKDPSITTAKEAAAAKAFLDDKIKKAKVNKMRYEAMLQGVTMAHKGLTKHFGKADYTKEEVAAIKTEDPTLSQNKAIASQMFGYGLTSLTQAIDELTKLVTSANELLNGDNLKHNYRKVLQDDENDFSKKSYGDNNPLNKSEHELHGTHVAGIVAAIRNNGKGSDGVTNKVKLMAVRAVPDGDEYDKDVALAIRYVVDNGAKVVNMSFGKAYSPHSDWVYDAIKYAAKHDVLLVKAAGNDGQDIDVQKNLHFPTDSPVNGATEIADNVLTVGAMTRHYDEKLVASFSNYGKTRVDIFAPGLEIYSSVPHNKYLSIQGTSMASPAVVGVAAMVRSYYPNLTAKQVKDIIINSGIEFHHQVIKPGTKDEMISFDEMSRKGRILNAYNALLLADKISKASKK